VLLRGQQVEQRAGEWRVDRRVEQLAHPLVDTQDTQGGRIEVHQRGWHELAEGVQPGRGCFRRRPSGQGLSCGHVGTAIDPDQPILSIAVGHPSFPDSRVIMFD
jgi:hypothetical protein